MSATNSITMKLIVDKSRSRVVFAECGEDMVDVLLSFLTLPIATIVQLLRKKGSPSLGCVDNLYKNVEALDGGHLTNEACRYMFLHPRSAVSAHYNTLKVRYCDLLDWENSKFFTCLSVSTHTRPRPLSYLPGTPCPDCEVIMDQVIRSSRRSSTSTGGRHGVAISMARYMVTDALEILPVSTESMVKLLDEAGVKQEDLEQKEVLVGCDEILLLLQHTLASDTVMTNVFMPPAEGGAEIKLSSPIKVDDGESNDKGNASSDFPCPYPENKVRLKLVTSKLDGRLLYGECPDSRLVELLFSYLTFPLGAVVQFLGGQRSSFLGCAGNLYCSVSRVQPRFSAIAEFLRNPRVSLYSSCKDMPISLAEGGDLDASDMYLCHNFKDCTEPIGRSCSCYANRWVVRLVDPRGTNAGGGFFSTTTPFMITDDLVVSTLSLTEVLSRMSMGKAKVASGSEWGVEERIVDIGKEEALAILRSCLTSKCALSEAFLEKKTVTPVQAPHS